MLTPAAKAAHRIGDDKTFDDRIAAMAAAKRSIAALKYSRGLAKAYAARSRADAALPAEHAYSVGDQCYYWRGVTKEKKGMGTSVDGTRHLHWH